MQTKQLIERNLKFTDKYIYQGITRGSIESGQVTCCDNCGKLITNMVSVASNTTRKQYTIGTDCAETLAKAKCMYNGYNKDYQIDIYSYNLTARFVTELNAGAKIQNNGWNCTLINRKGKQMQIFTTDIQKFFPQYL